MGFGGSDSYGAAGLRAATVGAAILLYLATCARSAGANPEPVRFRNPGAEHAYDAVEVMAPGLPAPVLLPVACAPGATCSAVVGLPPGNYPGLQIRARSGDRVSPLSNALDRVVAVPVPCTFDADGNGVLTAADFATFLHHYESQRWTAGDFAVFLSRFGQPCA